MNRRGVSLLEVLFAMLVGTIGLLGAISLLPVAIEQANKGREADSQMIIGESAIEEFKIRGGYLPDLWVVYDGANFLNFNGQVGAWQYHDGTNYITYDVTAAQWKKPDGSNANYTGVPPSQPAAFCYDPLGVANYLPGTPAYASFPYGRTLINKFPGGQRMPVMIRSGMARYTASGFNLSVMTPFQSVSPQMAETACFSHDEVRLLRQGNPSDPAVLAFETNSANPVNMRPHVEPDRQFSWFATLVPKSDGINDEYVLSIVVVHRRPLPIGTPDPLGERVAGIQLTDGVTGGDAILNGATEEDVRVQSGDWILLIGTSTSATGNGATAEDPLARYCWYRVVHSEADVNYTTTPQVNYARNVTLYGPDWNIPSNQTYAVLMTSVKGVYERTIRVQRSSLWY